MTEAVAPSAPAPSARAAGALRGGWVRGPAWDGLWMLGALWLAPLVVWLGRGHADLEASPVDGLYFVLSLLFWIGHRVSSTWLAYFTTAYRPLLRTQRTRFVWVPLGLTVFCFAVLLPPDDALPVSRLERFVLLGIVDYALVTWHFASQHYGVLSLYRLRAGQVRDAGARRVDRIFALGVGGVLVFVAEAVAGSAFYQDRWLDPVVSRAWLEGAQETLRTGGSVLVVAAATWVLVRDAARGALTLARSLYVLGVSAMVLAAFRVRDPFLFIVLWTAQHWMVAVGLAVLVAGADGAPEGSRWYRTWHAVNRRGWAALLALIALSVALLPFMEVEAVDEGSVTYADRYVAALGHWLRTSWLVPGLLALGLATAFVHYALDRAVYRFSDPDVRRAARGLLVTADGAEGTTDASRAG